MDTTTAASRVFLPRARGREHPLDERPVEPRVVRQDEARALDERARRLDVNPFPANVVLGVLRTAASDGLMRRYSGLREAPG